MAEAGDLQSSRSTDDADGVPRSANAGTGSTRSTDIAHGAAHSRDDVDGVPPATDVADGVWHRLDPRYVKLLRRRGFIRVPILGGLAALPLVLVAIGLELPAFIPAGAIFVVLVVLLWHAWAWPPLSYAHASYRLTEGGLEISRGVLWRRLIHVPRSRIQHTDVSQGPLERSLGLGTLSVYTAGTSFAQVDLDGLAHERALEIRAFLIQGAAGDDV
jgi:membrane protein YdbS with pleckstrin-like domain